MRARLCTAVRAAVRVGRPAMTPVGAGAGAARAALELQWRLAVPIGAVSIGAGAAGRPLASRGVHASAPLQETVHVLVPDLADSDKSADLTAWVKEIGDTVIEDEDICVLETSKVAVSVRAPCTGTLTEQLFPVDSAVAPGQHVATIESLEGAAADAARAASASAATVEATSATASPTAAAPVAVAVAMAAAPVATPVDSVAASWGLPPLQLVPLKAAMIHFRYGKHTPVAAAAAPTGAAGAVLEAQDYLELPALYGRLPNFTEEEMLRIDLGGADP